MNTVVNTTREHSESEVGLDALRKHNLKAHTIQGSYKHVRVKVKGLFRD